MASVHATFLLVISSYVPMLEQSFHTLYNAVHVVYFNVKGEKQLGGGRGPAEETEEL